MTNTKDVDVRKISRISNGFGVFLTKEVKKLGWIRDAFVTVRIEGDLIVLRKLETK